MISMIKAIIEFEMSLVVVLVFVPQDPSLSSLIAIAAFALMRLLVAPETDERSDGTLTFKTNKCLGAACP